jgi:hypothetical protein
MKSKALLRDKFILLTCVLKKRMIFHEKENLNTNLAKVRK